MKRLNIGIDVSKLKLDICILDENKKELEYLQIFNTENAITEFLQYLQKQYKDSDFYFGYEATGSYMRTLQRLLTENNYKHLMINPHTLSHYFKYIGIVMTPPFLHTYATNLYISDGVLWFSAECLRQEL